MKANIPNSSRVNILGNGYKSDQEIFSSVLKKWRQKLGYCSIVAAVPAVLVSNLPVSRSAETKKPQARVIGRGTRNLAKPNLSLSKRALLKRQSEFLLPHQTNSDGLATLAAGDDCPGRAIPGGNYTVATPFVDSSDTSGANDTVTGFPSYYYYYGDYSAHGPDHIYSFTLTGRGPNPQIEVTTTSGTYRPMIYVLDGSSGAGCPAGTGNRALNEWVVTDSRWWLGNNIATLNHYQVEYLPLNVPLYLVVDSALNDAAGAGAYTIKMQDITIAGCPNQIDCSDFFVRQHYLDFLNREPDAPGFAFWTNEINQCGADTQCIEVRRINDSGSFFLSIEFQESGYLVYRFYKAAFGDLPGAPVPVRYSEFLPDAQQVGQGVIVKQAGWQTVLENNKQAYANAFVQRPQFMSTYSTNLSPESFVDALFANAGFTPAAADRTAAINEFGGAGNTSDIGARGRALRRVAESETLKQQEFNRAFVFMQYVGYLRRNPNDAPDGNFDGYNFWLEKLNRFNGDFTQAEMVKAFVTSLEYRKRFGS
jgi:hypothetical protein